MAYEALCNVPVFFPFFSDLSSSEFVPLTPSASEFLLFRKHTKMLLH